MKSCSFMFLSCLASLCLADTPAHAADSFWNTPDAYLGETRPDETPRPFAAGRLAEAGTFIMGRSAFSRDGREFYFAQNDSWESGEHAKLRMMRFVDGRWSAPETIGAQALSPTLSLDEQTLYMRKKGMGSVWRARRSGDAWSEPVLFLERQEGLYDFMPTISGRYYIGSQPDEADKARGSTYVISVMTLRGKEPQVRSLGAPINAAGFNGDFFIAPDESYMVLSANITPTFESEAHIAFRKPDGSWTRPMSLGERVNNGKAHRWGYYVPANGDYLFFSHGTSEKDCGLQWVRFKELRERLRHQALTTQR